MRVTTGATQPTGAAGRAAARLLGPAALSVARGLGAGWAFAEGRRAPRPGAVERHPLVPAAVRLERSRSRGRRGSGEHTAVTVWFGEGPALPGAGPGRGPAATALRLGAGLLSAAALAAGTAAAARLAESPPRPRLGAPLPPRLEGPPAG